MQERILDANTGGNSLKDRVAYIMYVTWIHQSVELKIEFDKRRLIYSDILTWAVRFRNNSQVVEPPQLPEFLWLLPHDNELPKLPDHPLAREPPLVDSPGGGPLEDLGADQSSDVTAVVAFKSIRPPFEVGNFPGGLMN